MLRICSSRVQRSRGFTLTEVIVILAVIAILAAILFSSNGQSKATSYRTWAISNLKQVGLALETYIADFDNAYPYACSADDKFTVCSGEKPAKLPLVHYVLSEYCKTKEIWKNPLDTGIPNVANHDFSEPIECQLPGTSPSMFAKYGSSFSYRMDLAVDHATEPFELIEEGSNQVLDQSQVAVMMDAYGNWIGGPSVPAKKVTALFGDGHVKISPLVGIHQQGAFRKRK